ncbi:hypothetical protein ACFT9I_39530 [Streptomyces sp. NPDC057137]|uniref:hypothetical protein n=1 Tax=Streptomyces sp. NPDC057137 TaxID=3346030 RepID=UPI003632B8A2
MTWTECGRGRKHVTAPDATRLRDDLDQLGIDATISTRIQVALRTRQRYRRAALRWRAASCLAALLLIRPVVSGWGDFLTGLVGPESPGPVVAAIDSWVGVLPYGLDTPVVIVLAVLVSAAVFALLVGTVVAFSLLLMPLLGPPWAGGGPVVVVRRYAPVYVLVRAVRACATAHGAGGQRQVTERARVGVHLREVTKVLQNAHATRGTIPWRSRRRRDLKRHAGQVVAALREAEARLDSEPRAALTDLARLLLTIADRYAEGRVGALLDQDRLDGVRPVRDRGAVRLITATVLTLLGVVAVAFLQLPPMGEPFALGAAGIGVLALVYGRGTRRALDIADAVRLKATGLRPRRR